MDVWRRNRTALVALLMGLLPTLLLVLVGYTGTLSRYLADDFCNARWTRRLGLFRSIWYWYLTWNGRFTAYASDWLVMLPGPAYFPIVLPIALLLWVAFTGLAIGVLLRRLQDDRLTWLLGGLLGVLTVSTVLAVIPSVQEAFYWWSGMRLYTLPLAFLTLYVAVLALIEGRLPNRRLRAVAILTSLIYCLINAGFSEVYAVLQLGLLSVAVLAVLLRGRRDLYAVLLAGMAGTGIALLIMVLSPGNRVRETQFPTHPGLAMTLSIAWQSFAGMLGSFVTAGEKLLALIGVMLVAAWVGGMLGRPYRRSWLAPAVLAAGLLLTFGSFLPTSWGLSQPPPARVLPIPAFALTATLALVGFIIGAQLVAPSPTSRTAVVLAVSAVIAVNLSAAITIGKFYNELPTYALFAQRWDEEQAQILSARAAALPSVEVVSWPNWAGVGVLSDNPKNWLNQCVSGLYGIQVTGREP